MKRGSTIWIVIVLCCCGIWTGCRDRESASPRSGATSAPAGAKGWDAFLDEVEKYADETVAAEGKKDPGSLTSLNALNHIAQMQLSYKGKLGKMTPEQSKRHKALLNKITALSHGGTVVASLPIPAAPPASSMAVWQPEAELANQLGPYEDIEAYQIRIPKRFTRRAGSGRQYGWADRGKPLGAAPSLLIVNLTTEVTQRTGSLTLEELFNEFLDETSKTFHADWQQTPPEWGQIAGLTFLRTGWKGNSVNTADKEHGVTYVCRDGATIIRISIQCDQAQDLKLHDAAVTSLRKK